MKLPMQKIHVLHDFPEISLCLIVQAGLVLCQGYAPEKCHTNRTQNSHLKQCISWGLEYFQPQNRGLFKMIVRVLITCHTQYTWDRSICIFLFNRTPLQLFVTYLTGALYVHPLWFHKHQHDNQVRSMFVACQRWWFQWRFWFLPSVIGYLREDERHKPLEPSVQIHTPISSVLCMTSC